MLKITNKKKRNNQKTYVRVCECDFNMPSSFPCKHSVAAQFAIKITLVLIEEAEPIIMRGRQ